MLHRGLVVEDRTPAAIENVEDFLCILRVAAQAYVHLVPANPSLLVTLVENLFSVDDIELINLLLVGAVMLVITIDEAVARHIGSSRPVLRLSLVRL